FDRNCRRRVRALPRAPWRPHRDRSDLHALPRRPLWRRAGYMYGASLPRNPRGSVGAGLGHATSTGKVGIIPRTVEITKADEEFTADGVGMESQMAPNSEAPAEFHFYLPRYRALCIAENAAHTLHNILTLRGAVVRDARSWAGYPT